MTKVMQEVVIDKHIKLLDCPGIIFDDDLELHGTCPPLSRFARCCCSLPPSRPQCCGRMPTPPTCTCFATAVPALPARALAHLVWCCLARAVPIRQGRWQRSCA